MDTWPPLPPGVYGRRPLEALPFPFDRPGVRLTARARHGLWAGMRALGLRTGDEVLVPAYHHGSEIQAVIAAGLSPVFFGEAGALVPDSGELEALVSPRTRALHLTHFLGFPQDAQRWRTWCDERGLLLIEDAAQAWLAERDGKPVGALGDLTVFCLYKSFGLPDGAAMVATARLPAPGPRSRHVAIGLLRRHYAWLVGRSPAVAGLRAPGPDGPYDADAGHALGDPAQGAPSSTRFLLRRLVRSSAPELRRSNYRALLADLAPHVPAPFGALPAGAAPMALPVVVADKLRAIATLRRRGVEPLDLWSVPHRSLPAARFAHVARRRGSTLALPVHQELRAGDLDRIVTAAAEAIEGDS